MIADTTPHNLTELLIQIWNDWWWLLFIIVPSAVGGIAKMWHAITKRIERGGNKALPSKHYEKELTRRDRELIRLRMLLVEVAELNSITDPLDPRAITLPTKLSSEITAVIDDDAKSITKGDSIGRNDAKKEVLG